MNINTEFKKVTEVLGNPREYYTCTTQDIQVEIVPAYVSERSDPQKNQYFYSYKVRITNHGSLNCKVIQRHWKIKEGNGKCYDVQGTGIVGEQPMIYPGKNYEYVSFCPLNSPYGNMRGKYQLMDEFNNRFWIDVPVFFFRMPETFSH